MSPKNLDRWGRTRTKGKARFIFLWWVGCFGGWMLLFQDLIPAFWRYLHHQPAFSERTFHYVFDVVYWLVVGYIVGIVDWSSREKQWREYSGSLSSSPTST